MDRNESLDLSNAIMVTVFCKAYNQEKYIAEALDGFVKQKTNFLFEVLVHDDASTDGTAEIIRKYEKKYPSIIVGIYETENQYKYRRVTREVLLPRARGKYIACCEGDDYWTDSNKLQKQVDFLESHPEYSSCVHNTVSKYQESKFERIQYDSQDKDLELSDVSIYGLQSYHCVSLMRRKSTYYGEQPEFLTSIHEVGDYPTAIYLALCGKIRYFGNPMAVHRCEVKGSWGYKATADKHNNNRINITKQTVNMLSLANEFSLYKYDDIFKQAISYHELHLIMWDGKIKPLFKNSYFLNISILRKIKIIIKILMKRS